MKTKRVVLIMPYDVGYFANVTRGIGAYVLENSSWKLEFQSWWDMEQVLRTSERARPDGFIVDPAWRDCVSTLRKLKVPFVLVRNIPDMLEGIDAPCVGFNDMAIGRLGANHFLERGFTNFAYYGYPNEKYSMEREGGFRAAVEESGFTVSSFHWRYSIETALQAEAELGEWVVSLSKPLAVFTAHDWLGVRLVQVCRVLGLRVPEDVAILGVDNIDIACAYMHPPLSSIDPGADRVGYEAAAMLDRMMAGEQPPESPLVVAPKFRVIARQSTDIIAVSDPEIVDALRFIREHAAEPISVSDILDDIPIARRKLERQFRKLIGRSPLEEIRRMHIERAKELLAGTGLPMAEVARKSGLIHAAQLSYVFGKITGMTPTAYRKKYKPEIPSAK